jgi:hypothetical protein
MEIYKDEAYDLFVPRENVCSFYFFFRFRTPTHFYVHRLRNYPFEKMILEWCLLPIFPPYLWIVLSNLTEYMRAFLLFVLASLCVDFFTRQATKNRSVGATNLNRASSRSHAVLTVEVAMVDAGQHTSMFLVSFNSKEVKCSKFLYSTNWQN